MEQDDLEKFRYWESDGIGYLDCYHCNLNSGRTISNSDLETMGRPNLLELMEDAAAHFAEVHRKSNG